MLFRSYNDYFVSGTGGVLGYFSGANKTTLPLISGQDAHSLNTNPSFITPGATVATGYKLGIDLNGISGTGITIDFGSNPRYNPTRGAWEQSINKWKGTLSNDWNTPINWTANAVPAADATIVFDDAPINHCQMDQNRSVTHIFINQSTYRMVTNGFKLTVKGDLNFTNGAQIDASATNSTVEFAGTAPKSIPTGAFYNNAVYNLTVNNNNNLTLNGSLRLLNTITASSGKLDANTNAPTIIYGGSSLQYIVAGRFLNDSIYNLTIDNTTGVTLDTNFTVHNNLVINSGKVLNVTAGKALTALGTITNSAGNSGFVLKSDSTGTASLLNNTNKVPATVKRYIPGAIEDWHFLSSPMTAQEISGSWLPSGTYSNGTGYDMYIWNEPTNCWIYKLNPNWSTINPGANFVPGRGYLYSLQALHPTKEFLGNLNNGTISYGITAVSTVDSLKGFNLVGNPYPSSIDWQAPSGWSRSNLVTSSTGYDMWIWNPATNNYGAFNSATGVGTNNVTRYIAPIQAYFVLAASAGNLVTTNAVRTHVGANFFKELEENLNKFSLTVGSDAGLGSDEIILDFGKPENSNGAMKLFSRVASAPSLYMPTASDKLSVHYFTNPDENPVVPVNYAPGADGDYTIHCSFEPSNYNIVMLEDRQLHYIQNMKTNSVYNFKATMADATNRFVLYFGPDHNPTDNILPARIYTDGYQLIIDLTLITKETEVQVYDVLGQKLMQTTLQGESEHKLNLNSNTQVLLVYLRNPDGTLAQKLLYSSDK